MSKEDRCTVTSVELDTRLVSSLDLGILVYLRSEIDADLGGWPGTLPITRRHLFSLRDAITDELAARRVGKNPTPNPNLVRYSPVDSTV